MKIAIENVILKNMTIRQASEAYSVPKSTLGDRIKLLSRGGEATTKLCTDNKGTFKRTFDENTEELLYNHVRNLDNQLMPLSKKEFLKLAYQLAENMKIRHRFNKEKKMAGKDFYYEFMSRHQELSLRTAESTSLQRAAGFNKAQVSRFFDHLATLIERHNFSPANIFNADETGVSVVHNNTLKVISVKGKKQVGKLTSAERGRNVTILLSINATGDLWVPPLFVFPRARIDQELKKDAPIGSIFDGQKSGWITAEGFLKWMHLFVERVKPSEKNPVLLLLDGHSSHKDLSVITYAKQNHIHMLSLPPHTSHKLQPLDRAVMKPFKNAYNDACAMWMRKYPNLKISLKDISGLVNVAFSRVCRMELAQSGFKCTGIHPFDRTIFSDLDFSASLNNVEEDATGDTALRPILTRRPSSNQEAVPVPSSTQEVVLGPSSRQETVPVPSSTQEAVPGPFSRQETIPVPSSKQEAVPGPSSRQEAVPGPRLEASHRSPRIQYNNEDKNNTNANNLNLSPIRITEEKPILSAKPTDCENLLLEISPLPSTSNLKFKSRTNRAEKSEILTSTPYKNQVLEKKRIKKEKLDMIEEKKKLKTQKENLKQKFRNPKKKLKPKLGLINVHAGNLQNLRPTTLPKRKIEGKYKVRKSLKFDSCYQKTQSDVSTTCIICAETFEEDWIQCSKCEGWAHENCANLEGESLFYICDYCKC